MIRDLNRESKKINLTMTLTKTKIMIPVESPIFIGEELI